MLLTGKVHTEEAKKVKKAGFPVLWTGSIRQRSYPGYTAGRGEPADSAADWNRRTARFPFRAGHPLWCETGYTVLPRGWEVHGYTYDGFLDYTSPVHNDDVRQQESEDRRCAADRSRHLPGFPRFHLKYIKNRVLLKYGPGAASRGRM